MNTSETSAQIIHEFLQAFQPEVSGLSSDEVSPELETQIGAFASGDLQEGELNSFARDVLRSEDAMERLASLLGAGGARPD